MGCDIIIPIWNKKELTKNCIDSIVRCTIYPYKIIAVDNASNLSTKEYLESLKKQDRFDFILIRNEQNLGNTKAVNQGIVASRGEFICILDNDTVVTPGWLEEMVAIAQSQGNIGIVNPLSNTLGTSPRTNSARDIEECARECLKYKGQYVELGACVGFCTVVKREVIDKIGGWDEAFSPGYFDDTEYSYRAMKAGYKSVCAKGAYVYHSEHASFKDKNLEKFFKKNEELFYQKVGRPKRILYILTKDNRDYFEKLKKEVYDLVNHLNWVAIFRKHSLRSLERIKHMRIKFAIISDNFFRVRCLFKVLVKKKRFTHIFVDDRALFNTLRGLKRLHKAEVNILT
jgi:GT2 family glycosyltransferase